MIIQRYINNYKYTSFYREYINRIFLRLLLSNIINRILRSNDKSAQWAMQSAELSLTPKAYIVLHLPQRFSVKATNRQGQSDKILLYLLYSFFLPRCRRLAVTCYTYASYPPTPCCGVSVGRKEGRSCWKLQACDRFIAGL